MYSEQQWEEIRKNSDEDLYRLTASQSTHSQIQLLAETELRRRELKVTLDSSKKLVKGTQGLVKATWGLVFITFLLVVVTAILIFKK